jgi:hypothetical protein
VLALGLTVSPDSEPSQSGNGDDPDLAYENRCDRHNQCRQRNEEPERTGSPTVALACPVHHVADHDAAHHRSNQAKEAAGERAEVSRSGQQDARHETDDGSEQGHAAASRSPRPRGTGQHPDRNANSQLETHPGEEAHWQNLHFMDA